MMSLETFAASWLLYPAAVLFFMMLLPLPVLPGIAAKIVGILGTPATRYKVNLIKVTAIVSTLVFLWDLYQHYKKYFDTPKPAFTNLAMEAEYMAKKWRLERDLYISGMTCVLYFALDAIADLRRKITAVTKRTDSDKKNQ